MTEKTVLNLFDEDLGHHIIQDQILHTIKSDRIPHAFLFFGSEGTGKEAFAIQLAKLLNCAKGPHYICNNCTSCKKISNLQHPDLKYIFPTPSQSNIKAEDIAAVIQEKAKNPYKRVKFPGKNIFISIDTIRELKQEAKFKLYEGKKKIFIISEADEMRPEAANALLKILEEPPSNLMLILTTSKMVQILPTIKSRCQLIHFPVLGGDTILKIVKKYAANLPEHLPHLIRLSSQNIKLTFDFIEDDVMEKRNDAVDYLRKTAVIEKSQELVQFIGTICSKRDRRTMKMLLYFVQLWFRDLLHLKIRGAEANLMNSDLEKNLSGFLKGYPQANYQEIIYAVERAIKDLEDLRNLNPTLIFTNLSIKINQLMKFGVLT